MKFNVNKNAFGNEVDVTLNYETKEKLKKTFFFGLYIPACALLIFNYVNKRNKKAQIEE